jgi:hypothetical protein
VAIDNGYVDGAALTSHMAATATGWDESADVERAIETASRDLDAWCGRRFWKDADASARVFYPSSTGRTPIDDAWEVVSFTIDGTAAVLDDYDQLPLNGIVDGLEGWPVTALALPRDGYTPMSFTGRVVVTARWGWAAVPTPVETACLQLAAENMKMGEAPFGVAGIAGDGSAVRIGKLSPQVRGKLQPYRTGKMAVPVG